MPAALTHRDDVVDMEPGAGEVDPAAATAELAQGHQSANHALGYVPIGPRPAAGCCVPGEGWAAAVLALRAPAQRTIAVELPPWLEQSAD